MTIQRAALPALILAAMAIGLAGAAGAKTSLSHSQQICESAVKAQSPAPKSERVDDSMTRADDDTAVFTLNVRQADDSTSKVICSIDRKTSKPTLTQSK